MDRQSVSMEWQAPVEKVPEQSSVGEGSFVDRLLRKRKQSRDGGGLSLSSLATKPEAPQAAPDRPLRPEAAQTHAPEVQDPAPEVSAAFLAQLHTLGEHTLHVVFATKDRLTTATQESDAPAPVAAELPEMAQLDTAAEDVDDALEQLDSVIDMSAEPMAEPEVMYERSQEERGVSEQNFDIDPVLAAETDTSMESTVPSGWSRGVRASALHIAGKMAHRLEAHGTAVRRPATTAELGIVAAIVGGPLGLLFVGERSSRRREIRQFRKEQRKLEAAAVEQQEVIEQHEQQLAAMERERSATSEHHPEALAQMRHEAQQVAVEAHQQADTIRSAAVEAKVEQRSNETLSQSEINKPTPKPEQLVAPERPQPAILKETETQPHGFVERIKPLLGVETPESESVAKKVAGDGMSAGGGGTPLERVREMLDPATLSQNPIVQQAKQLQKTIQSKAQEPVWLYGAALAAGLIAVISWIFWR